MLSESLYVNLYLNNNCCANTVAASNNFLAFKDYTTTWMSIKVAYQQNDSINNSIRQMTQTEQGLIIPFEYISNFSYIDSINAAAHTVGVSLRIYNMIGNKLRKLYIIPISVTTPALAQNVSTPYESNLDFFTSVQLLLDSNIITQYNISNYENLLNCRLSNKYWNATLQQYNIFLPVYFCSDGDNINEGFNVSSDTIISYNATSGANAANVSHEVFAVGVKNLIINKNGVLIA